MTTVEKINILTVLRKSEEYTPEKVKIIKGMVERNLTIPFNFICLSDVEIPDCNTIPLIHHWKGWYAKLELFRPDLPIGPKFYLDLDTVIVKNIDSLIKKALNYDFIVLRDFYRGIKNPRAMGSGLMFWNIPNLSLIYKKYLIHPIELPGGDQSVLENYLIDSPIVTYWQDITNEIASFKVHIKPFNKIDDKYSIICFHGKPRPWDPNQKIVKYR